MLCSERCLFVSQPIMPPKMKHTSSRGSHLRDTLNSLSAKDFGNGVDGMAAIARMLALVTDSEHKANEYEAYRSEEIKSLPPPLIPLGIPIPFKNEPLYGCRDTKNYTPTIAQLINDFIAVHVYAGWIGVTRTVHMYDSWGRKGGPLYIEVTMKCPPCHRGRADFPQVRYVNHPIEICLA
jgi:hypothetical protein